ncbi:MAG TPA: Fur family transcriptional regulator [Cryptosporangiaceae bacterium]|nr:Fur family transcriptional regulator [Cryptosporangiaceae bacterium]
MTAPTHTPDAATVLRAAGLRVTQPRLTVLAALAEHPHADVDAIATAARRSLGALSTQAVYDILHAFVQARLARRIQPAGHPARFETRVGDNHHHVVCRRCGDASDVDCAAGYAPCLEPDTTSGFAVDEAEVLFWGLCPRCQ